MNDKQNKGLETVEAVEVTTVDSKTESVKTIGATADTVDSTSQEIAKDIKGEDKHADIQFSHINTELVYDVMSQPTCSNNEYRLATFLVLWARSQGISYEFDNYGNVYLTKGKVEKDEYYPCVTAHIDTVQDKQLPYAEVGLPLEIKTRISASGNHEIYCDGFGLGGDDKGGVCLCLSMFSHFDTLKACFFLEEEIGCVGSSHLNTEWFKNVGYVIGYDSPELNRAAWASSGIKLFSAKFFKEHMKDICAKHGLTDFRSEPITDVREIRKQTDIMCMNFGTGYYNCHMLNEYCVLEEMNTACHMGYDLIMHLGKNRYELKCTSPSYGSTYADEDEKYLRTLSSTYKAPSTTDTYSYSGGNSSTSYGSGYKSSASTTTKTSTSANETNKSNNKDYIHVDCVDYIVRRYEERIKFIKESVKDKLTQEELEKIFDTTITF